MQIVLFSFSFSSTYLHYIYISSFFNVLFVHIFSFYSLQIHINIFFTKTCNFFYINTYIYRYFFSYQFNPHIFHNSQLFPLISYLFFHFHSYPLLSSRFFRSQLQRKSGRRVGGGCGGRGETCRGAGH